MQLLAIGMQGLYLAGNPEMSYFKAIYKRHTHFSMESIRLTFENKPILDYSNRAKVTCIIARNADLVKEIILSFQLPNIYSDDRYRFQWIPKIGTYLVHYYTLNVGGQVIDRRYGEWLDIWNELSIPVEKRAVYDELTGNTEDLYSPQMDDTVVNVVNNRFRYIYYPIGEAGKPSIKSKRLFLPLQFYFSKNPALALPLIALQYHQVTVDIEFRALRELYQVFDSQTMEYVGPDEYMARYTGTDVRIGRFLTADPLRPEASMVDLDAYLEINYIFLDELERKKMAESTHDFLIEQVFRIELGGVLEHTMMDLVLQHPVKELVWITRRSDIYKYNDWSNFTNRIPQNSKERILRTSRILFNGMDRFEEKDASYFHTLQPYLHHSNSPRQGIYCYSFSLYPERHQPSGFVNMSVLNKVQMHLTTEPRESLDYDYEVVCYSLSYNIFRVLGGMGGIVFST